MGSTQTLAVGHPTAPTKKNILNALDTLTEAAEADDLAIVLFSGHGLDGKLLKRKDVGFSFLAQDSNVDANTHVTRDDIAKRLSRLPCRCLLLLDTCRSEAARIKELHANWSLLEVGPQILTSCGSGENSVEDQRMAKGHGIFTAAVLEALTGRMHNRRRK